MLRWAPVRYLSLLFFRLAASAVAWLNRWRGMLIRDREDGAKVITHQALSRLAVTTVVRLDLNKDITPPPPPPLPLPLPTPHRFQARAAPPIRGQISSCGDLLLIVKEITLLSVAMLTLFRREQRVLLRAPILYSPACPPLPPPSNRQRLKTSISTGPQFSHAALEQRQHFICRPLWCPKATIAPGANLGGVAGTGRAAPADTRCTVETYRADHFQRKAL